MGGMGFFFIAVLCQLRYGKSQGTEIRATEVSDQRGSEIIRDRERCKVQGARKIE
jgi:hypothetical protein